MGNRAIKEYIALLRKSYQVTFRRNKQKILNEICTNLGWHRKSAIRALNRPQSVPSKPFKKKKKYSWQAQYHLRKLWKKMDYINSKCMVAALPTWLRTYNQCNDEVKAELKQMSKSTIDRYLKRYRANIKRKNNTGTKPGSSKMKNIIPLKT